MSDKLRSIFAILVTMTFSELAEFCQRFGIRALDLFDIKDNSPEPVVDANANRSNYGMFNVVLRSRNNAFLVNSGRLIRAIKLYREHTGVGLKVAKEEVDNVKLHALPLTIASRVPRYIADAIRNHWLAEDVVVEIDPV